MKNSSDISKMKDLCDSHPEEAEKPKNSISALAVLFRV